METHQKISMPSSQKLKTMEGPNVHISGSRPSKTLPEDHQRRPQRGTRHALERERERNAPERERNALEREREERAREERDIFKDVRFYHKLNFGQFRASTPLTFHNVKNHGSEGEEGWPQHCREAKSEALWPAVGLSTAGFQILRFFFFFLFFSVHCLSTVFSVFKGFKCLFKGSLMFFKSVLVFSGFFYIFQVFLNEFFFFFEDFYDFDDFFKGFQFVEVSWCFF